MNWLRKLRFLILSLLLAVVGYLRGYPIPLGLTSSFLIVGLLGVGVFVVVVGATRHEELILTRRWWLWYALLGYVFVSFLYNVVWRPYPLITTRFIAEFLLSALLTGVFVFLLDRELLAYVYRSFVLVSTIMSLVLVFVPVYVGVTDVRRVGGGAMLLSGAVNNVGQMIAIAIIIATVSVLTAKDWRQRPFDLSVLPVLLMGLILTGSRRAIFALALILLAFVVLYGESSKRVIGTMGAATVVSVAVLMKVFDLAISRLSLSSVSKGLGSRADIYRTVSRQVDGSLVDVLFGAGMYRYGEIAPVTVQQISYPHNVFLSLFAHIGLPSAVIFGLLLVVNSRYLASRMVRGGGPSEYLIVSTFFSLFLTLIYASLGGRLTRIFTIWIFIGIAEYLYMSEVLESEHNSELLSRGGRP